MRVELSAHARADLDDLETALSLPDDLHQRVQDCLRPLNSFPYAGRALPGRWRPLRVWGGPWRWMLLVYEVLEETGVVLVVTIRDARSLSSPTSPRGQE